MSRTTFETWAVTILGDNPAWKESGECELAWQAWQAASSALKAQEPSHFICHGHLYPWPSEDNFCGNPEDHIPLFLAAGAQPAPKQGPTQPGYQIVPVEPTPEMLSVAVSDEGALITDGRAYAFDLYKEMLAAAPVQAQSAPKQEPTQPGYQLVPVEPTEGMVIKFAQIFNVSNQSGTFRPAYKAMLAAAKE